jgi:hypothetical protein
MTLEKLIIILKSHEFQTSKNISIIHDFFEKFTALTINPEDDWTNIHLIRIGSEMADAIVQTSVQCEVKIPSSHTIQGLYFGLLMSYDEPWLQFSEVGQDGKLVRCVAPLFFNGEHKYVWHGLT